MLQFKPGRDVSMLNAILHTIVEEKLYDQQYVQANADDFDKLVENVKDYPPEEMEKICGIPAETLREVARLYARAESGDHLLGHGHLAAHPRHRQHPLPDRHGALRPARSAGRAPASTRCAARTTSRARRMRG